MGKLNLFGIYSENSHNHLQLTAHSCLALAITKNTTTMLLTMLVIIFPRSTQPKPTYGFPSITPKFMSPISHPSILMKKAANNTHFWSKIFAEHMKILISNGLFWESIVPSMLLIPLNMLKLRIQLQHLSSQSINIKWIQFRLVICTLMKELGQLTKARPKNKVINKATSFPLKLPSMSCKGQQAP